MKPIVLYSRVSTQIQEFESQLTDLKKWAKANDFTIVKSFGEKVSGFSLDVERKEFDNMKSYVIENNIKDIACWEISRFGRSAIRTQIEIKEFTDLKVNIHFKKEGMSTLSNNSVNNIFITLLAAMADFERNTIIERNMRGKISAAESGKAVNYGVLPYGYKKDDNGRLIINEEEAKAIRIIYDEAIKGTGVGSIANHLNSLSIPTRHTLSGRKRKLESGKEINVLWRTNTVRRILHSRIYIGDSRFRGIEIKIPAIISLQDWEKVQQRFENNTGYSNRTKYEYLFKGKLRCGKCNLIYSTNTRDGVGSYYCSGRKDKGIKCRNGQIHSSFLDEQLWRSLFSFSKFFKASKSDFERKSKKAELQSQIDFYASEIQKLEKKHKKVIQVYIDGEMEKEKYNSERRSIRNKITECSNQIKVLQSHIQGEDSMAWPKRMVEVLLSKDFNVRRDAIENLIDKVLIYQLSREEIEIPNLDVQDKIYKLEIFAFGSSKPLKVILTTRTKHMIIPDLKDPKIIDFSD
jgi:DNA invertase Pin-like site-specific DNA recombinase